MNTADVWAVVPIKETAHAKQRLGDAVPAGLKPRLALAMAEDVLIAERLDGHPLAYKSNTETSTWYRIVLPVSAPEAKQS